MAVCRCGNQDVGCLVKTDPLGSLPLKRICFTYPVEAAVFAAIAMKNNWRPAERAKNRWGAICQQPVVGSV